MAEDAVPDWVSPWMPFTGRWRRDEAGLVREFFSGWVGCECGSDEVKLTEEWRDQDGGRRQWRLRFDHRHGVENGAGAIVGAE